MVNVLGFRSEGWWFEARSLLFCLLRQVTLLHIVPLPLPMCINKYSDNVNLVVTLRGSGILSWASIHTLSYIMQKKLSSAVAVWATCNSSQWGANGDKLKPKKIPWA